MKMAKFVSAGVVSAVGVAALVSGAAGDAELREPFDIGAEGARVVLDATIEPLRRGDVSSGTPAAAAFPLSVGGARVPLSLMAFETLPGRSVVIEAPGHTEAVLTVQSGSASVAGAGVWTWTPPSEPGAYGLRVSVGESVAHLTALVLHPAEDIKDGALDGYAIGAYRRTPLGGSPAYLPPVGFARVSAHDEDILVSPHFTLGQFLCKQPGQPRFLALSAPLVIKLEAVVARLAREGIPGDALIVMSGFRTPAYNRAIGNTTDYSRHLWGDAADIYVDADRNGRMDDLNGDGRSDELDAHLLARWIEDLMERPGLRPGGLATYRSNQAHGPFVHVDARGSRARW